MPRPLVPRAGVVAGVVAGAAQGERRQCGAGAGVAVRDQLSFFGKADEFADPLRSLRQAGTGEELADLDELRAGNVALSRIAVAAAAAGVLGRRAHVEGH